MTKKEYAKKMLVVADETLNELQPVVKNAGEKLGTFLKEEFIKGIENVFSKGRNKIKNKIDSK